MLGKRNRLHGSHAWTNAGAPAVLARYEALVQRIASSMHPQAALGHCLDGDDLVAEGRVAVLEAVASYEGYGSSEFGWVARRVRFRMLDAIRRLDVRSRPELEAMASQRVSEDAGGDPLLVRVRHLAFAKDEFFFEASDSSQEEAASAKQLLDLVREVISRMPPRDRTVAELVILDGGSVSDAAKKLGVSVARASQICIAAREDVRAYVADMIA